ncbi:MAG TPA: hypothetical protein VJZ48_02585 [Bacilli bacterium]|nr:hypothetical protein [Bacilli bacterium]
MLYFTQAELLIKHDNALFNRLSKAEDDIGRIKVYLNAPVESLNNRAVMSDYAFLFRLNSVLSTILSITNKPHITVQDKDIILRSSLVSEFNNEKFIQTLRESDLWALNKGKFIPEHSHTSEYLDNVKIYENIVVMMCFHLIEKVINRIDVHYQSYTRGLSSAFAFDNYSVTSLFNANNTRLIDKTLVSREDIEQLRARLHLIKRKVHLINSSLFYAELKDTKPIMSSIVLTNILKFNRRYKQVFHFYNELLKNNNSVAITTANRNYYISLLFKVLNSNLELKEEKQTINDKHINTKFSNDKFTLTLLSKNQKTFLIKVKANRRKSIHTTSSLTLINDFNEYQPILEVNAYEYVLVGEEIFRYINKQFIPLKYHYSQGDLSLINTLISSLVVHVNLEKNHVPNTCPVCGSNTINIRRRFDMTCLNCEAEYALINADTDKPFVWIKKVKIGG